MVLLVLVVALLVALLVLVLVLLLVLLLTQRRLGAPSLRHLFDPLLPCSQPSPPCSGR
jgi:hypothetical protein